MYAHRYFLRPLLVGASLSVVTAPFKTLVSNTVLCSLTEGVPMRWMIQPETIYNIRGKVFLVGRHFEAEATAHTDVNTTAEQVSNCPRRRVDVVNTEYYFRPWNFQTEPYCFSPFSFVDRNSAGV